MVSYPSFEEVCSGLGDKMIDAICTCAGLTKKDLDDYRTIRPLWVSQSSERGLANWIHDRMWAHLVEEVSGVPNIGLVDREPHREVYVSTRYRLRVKRHHSNGAISTYSTQAAIEFMAQDEQLTLDGLEEVRLMTGYLWEPDLREVGVPVLSLRDGRDKIVWMEPLQPTAGAMAAGVVDLTVPPLSGPAAPKIEFGTPPAEEVGSG